MQLKRYHDSGTHSDGLDRLTKAAVFDPSGREGNFLLTAEEQNRLGADYKNRWSR